MSLHKFAEQVAAHGRGDDSLLVHMTPDEVQRLQAFAEANGTTMTLNPDTGLPEAGFLSDLFKAVAPIALGAFLGPAGAALGGGFMSAGMAGLTVGGITTLATGSLSRGLMAGLGAYGGAGLAEGLMGAGANAGLTDALAGSTSGNLGQAFGDVAATPLDGSSGTAFNKFLTSNANPATQSFGDMASAGAKAVADNPMQFAKDNFKYLSAAASPIMAAAMVPTTTKVPELTNNASVRQYIRNEDGTLTAMNPVPAAGYGTPAFKPFAGGGIVALNNGGVPGYAGNTGSVVGGGGLENIYRNLGGEGVYKKIADEYLAKTGGNTAGLAAIMSKYDTPVAAPAAVAPIVAAPAGIVAAPAAVTPAALTPQQQAMELMYKSSTVGGNLTPAFDALGGQAAARKLAESAGFNATPEWIANYERTMGYKPSASTVANTKLATDNLPGLYASLGGGDATKGKAAYDKIAADYTKAGGNVANLASILYDETAGTFYNPERLSTNSTFKANNLGYSEEDINRYVNSDAAKTISNFTGRPITAESHIQDVIADGKRYVASSGLFTPEEVAKMSNKQLLAAAELFTQGGGARKINGFTQQDVDFIRNEANNYGGLLYSANFQAIGDKGDVIGNQAKTATTGTADTTGTIGSQVTSNGIVDLKTDTGVKQDTKDTTTVGKSTLATTTPSAIKSNVTTDGTYTGTSGTAPTMGTLFGQGKFVGTGTEMGTGTTGPILDFGGTSPFGTTSPMTLAKTQIAEEAAAKTAADKAKLDLYSQWGASNPKATNLEHANFVDKIGLEPAVAARLIGISPEQAQTAYNDAKYNKQTGDSEAAYRYLMGQGAYPTKSKVGEIARPYAEATLGYPASTNRQFIYDAATGKYNRNPDYVAEYRDPSGGVNYKMSPSEVFNYFKTNAGQGDDATYSWAVANNLTPQDIANATGAPLSQVAAKWRAAKAKQSTAAADKKAADDKAAADANANQSGGGGDARGGLMPNHTYHMAAGGMPSYAVGGGLGSLGSYSDGGRLLRGPGDGVSDSIPATIGDKQQPARLADGEFVVPARIVSELGNGSTDAGAKKLYAMMDRVQRARGKTTGKNKVAANSRADKYLPA